VTPNAPPARRLVLDTETGGLDPQRFSILSVGAVVWESGRVLAEYEYFVAEPEIITEPEAMAVNGLDLDWIRTAGERPESVVAKLKRIKETYFSAFRRVPLVLHNAEFDLGFLRRLFRLAGDDFEAHYSHRAIDTQSTAEFLILAGRLSGPSSSLGSLADHFGIRVARPHNALSDALATGEVLTRLIALAADGRGGDSR